MVCPMCITAAIVANAPAIAAAASGAAAAKLAYDRRDAIARRGQVGVSLRGAGAEGRPAVSRLVVDKAALPPVGVPTYGADDE